MTLIRYSNGGFSHSEVMNLTFSLFYEYLDALEHCLNSETPEGQKRNAKKDRLDDIRKLDHSDVDDIKRKVEEFKNKRRSK